MSKPQTFGYVPRDVMPAVADRQIMRYREMGASEKLAVADSLWDVAFEAAQAGVRMRNPTMSDSAVAVEARLLLRNATD